MHKLTGHGILSDLFVLGLHQIGSLVTDTNFSLATWDADSTVPNPLRVKVL